MLNACKKEPSATEARIHAHASAEAQHDVIQRQFVAAICATEKAAAAPVLVPPSIGVQNQSLMSHFTRVKRVAVILARRGFIVRKIEVTPGNALVILKSARGCRDLGGEQICHSLCGGMDERAYAVMIDGVRVQWTVSRAVEKGSGS